MRRKHYDKNLKVIKVNEMKKMIENLTDYNHTIPCLCDMNNIKYNTMRKWFKDIEDLSIKEFYQKCKLKHAKMLLRTTDDKIISISYKLGFKNYYDFIKWFKMKTGKNTTSFRLYQNYHSK